MDFNLAFFVFILGMFAGAFLASKEFRVKVMGYLNKEKPKAPEPKPGANEVKSKIPEEMLEPISRTETTQTLFKPKTTNRN